MFADREDVGETASEWRKIIEIHQESKLIFSAGQRTGYGNKKRNMSLDSAVFEWLCGVGGGREGRREEDGDNGGKT